MNKRTQEAITLIKDNLCVFCGSATNEDLRKWFGKGGQGGSGGGGWDRYSSTGFHDFCRINDHIAAKFIQRSSYIISSIIL